MSFSVFGVNKVKCKDAAFKFIANTESGAKSVIITESEAGGHLGKHFENVLSGGVCPDQYERAMSRDEFLLWGTAY